MFYEYYTRKSDHFATYPPALVEPCIKAGTSERGVCPKCGAGWVRVVERDTTGPSGQKYGAPLPGGKPRQSDRTTMRGVTTFDTRGFRPSCTCDAGDPIPATVLDPFSGSGTTGAVAVSLGRAYVGLDLNPEYLELARQRIGLAALDEWTNGKRVAETVDLGPLFGGGL